MGKGTIISGGTGGQYQVSVIYNTERAQAEKEANIAEITNLEAQIADETMAENPDEQRLNVLRLQKLSLERRNEALDAIPETLDISAWCADLTENLAGDVGLIEVPGESVAFNIQPGYEDNAAYDVTRDGQLFPTRAMSPAAAFYSLAMLPGWQKWRPTYRYATISNLNKVENTCSITLEATTSTQQSLNVNAQTNYSNVPVEYMSCNAAAFENGDSVLVAFIGQDRTTPKVIGFKDNPSQCGYSVILINIASDEDGSDIDKYYLWSLETNEELSVLGNDGVVIPDPSESEAINYIGILGVSGVVSDLNFSYGSHGDSDDIGVRYTPLESDLMTPIRCPLLTIPQTPYSDQSEIFDMDGDNYYNVFTSEIVGDRSPVWTAEIHNFHGQGININYSDDTKSCFAFHQTEDRDYEYLEYNAGGFVIKARSWINKTHEIHSPYGAIEIDAFGVTYYSCRITESRGNEYQSFKRELSEIHDLTPQAPYLKSSVGQNSFLNLFSMPVRELESELDDGGGTITTDKYQYTVIAGAEYYADPSTDPADMTRAEIISVGRNTDLEDFISGKLGEIDDTVLLDLTCNLYE